MIHKIDTADNIVAFRALGIVTNEDYKKVVIPEVEQLAKQSNEINFLLFVDTDFKNFTTVISLQDIMMGFKDFGLLKRAAIVSDSEEVIFSTNGCSDIVPGEFRGFKKQAFNKALNWVEGNTNS